MHSAWVVPLVSALGSLVLAGVVRRRKPQTEVTQVFSFLTIMLVSWNLIFFVLYSVANKDLALALARFFRVGSFFVPPAILHLIIALRPQRPRFWNRVLAIDYAMATIFIVANACDLYIADIERFAWGYHSVPTAFYNGYGVYALLNFAGALLVIAYTYRTSTEPRTRLQLKFWLLGALVALPLGLTNLFPVYGIPVYPLGNLGNAAWAGITAYAIVRHRLMDIDLVITKGIAYSAVSFAVLVPACVIMLWVQRASFGEIHAGMSATAVALFLIVGLLFPVLRTRAESRIERSLFPRRFGHRAALAAFTRSIVRILDQDRLLRELGSTLASTLEIESLAIAIGGQHEPLTVRYALGTPIEQQQFPRDGAFVQSLTRYKQAVLRSELESSHEIEESTIAAEVYRRNGWELCLPLALGGKMSGFIGLGRKRNLAAFYIDDVELLETLAAEAAVALENARLYEELRRSQDIIRRADRLSALGTLAAGIAHEVRNPLVSIQTFFQLAPQRMGDQEFFTSFLSMTAEEVKRISNLINELLSFARSSTPSLRAVNLNELAERVITLLEPEARKHKLTLSCALSANTPLISADGDQIKQVLINLVLNAIQATAPGGHVSISTRSVDHHTGAFGQLEVHDTGAGIPQERLEHIFDPFFTTKAKGPGLGLAIAHQIITEHGGSIRVESREGHGSSFFVNLPAYAKGESFPAVSDEKSNRDSFPVCYVRARKAAS